MKDDGVLSIVVGFIGNREKKEGDIFCIKALFKKLPCNHHIQKCFEEEGKAVFLKGPALVQKELPSPQ